MRKISRLLSVTVILVASILFTSSCTTVESGHKAVIVSWGGKTDMTTILPEGMDTGFRWVYDDAVQYDVREHTIVKEFSFNDKNDMTTTVKVALDYALNPKKLNKLHVLIKDVDLKILTSLSSASKEVVPQYSAVDLNKHKRAEGEFKLEEILREELTEFYVDFKRVRFTDINIPNGISKLAEETAVQIGRNELATKKEAEQTALAKARIAESKGKFEAAQYDVKTKELMSRPAVLKLYEAETERKWAEKGVSRFGNNNVFGSGVSIFKNK